MRLLPEKNKMKVVVALSGGIDSSVSAYILKNKGFEVIGVTGVMFKSESSDNMVKKAEIVAKKLGIEHHVLDLSQVFQNNVINYFNRTYQKGYTPNPCIVCNKTIKWGKLFDWAINDAGADFYATGHYAKIILKNDKYFLYPSDDTHKDQIYYLFELTQNQLAKTMFPLSDYAKSDIKKMAFELGFAEENTYKESQDVCFIQKNSNLQKYLSTVFGKQEGDFVEINSKKRLGIHKGYYQYTIGQRKGIGIAYSEPLYVVDIDAKENIVYLGVKKELEQNEITLKNVHFVEPPENSNFEAFVKIRNNMQMQKAKIELDVDRCIVKFEHPVSAVTKGQAAVLYDIYDKHLIGGAWIE